MSVIATALKHLMAAGLSGDALVEAVAEMELALQPKRSSGADRTARWRAKRHGDVTSVTGDEQKEKVSHTLPKEKINTTTRVRAKTDLPNDWEPDAKIWALADQLGLSSGDVWDQIDRMRDWTVNAGAKGQKKDWSAFFRTWLKRTADERRSRPQAASQRNSIADSFAILDAVTDEAIRRSGGRGPEGSEEDSFGLPGLRQSAA